jgi:hypothetical protein
LYGRCITRCSAVAPYKGGATLRYSLAARSSATLLLQSATALLPPGKRPHLVDMSTPPAALSEIYLVLQPVSGGVQWHSLKTLIYLAADMGSGTRRAMPVENNSRHEEFARYRALRHTKSSAYEVADCSPDRATSSNVAALPILSRFEGELRTCRR